MTVAQPALFTPAWHAELELAYARQQDWTRPVLRRHLGPLRVQKHLHAEGPGVCQHIIVHPPGGIAGGDSLTLPWTSASGPGPSSPAPARPSGTVPPAARASA